MDYRGYFPFWDKLTQEQQERIGGVIVYHNVEKGTRIHDSSAECLGTAREVVTRMLRYFQGEGMVALTRGTIELTDEKKLQDLLDA